ncbi:MAG: hypothetical protein SH821_17405 [Phototrophicales bacterium]|nr:hypothetical protein [Phototrophicales bacterium]
MLTINEKLHYSPIAMNYLGEGTPDISESMEVASDFPTITAQMIHIGCRVKVPVADEGCISQMGVVFEGRDNNDTQDAKFIAHIFTAYIS